MKAFLPLKQKQLKQKQNKKLMKKLITVGLMACIVALTGFSKPAVAQGADEIGIYINYSIENIPTEYRSWDAKFYMDFPEIGERFRWEGRLQSGSTFDSYFFLPRMNEYKGVVTFRVVLYRNGRPQYQGIVSEEGYWNAWTDQRPIVIERFGPIGE